MTTIQTAIPLLDVRDLTIEFRTRRGLVRAVERISLSVAKGETLGIVGESGSGKSVTSYAVMRILDRAGRVAQGAITFSGIDLTAVREEEMRDLRGREISMIFQNPRAALNPIRKVGRQLEDVLIEHVQATRHDAKAKALELLELVRIARPQERYHAYPFELSGGMCQRIVIALALACRPRLLIADEPTTGLDVTTQKAVMDLIVELTRERAMSTVLITHDLGLAAAYCDRVAVMEKGRIVETAASRTIFKSPAHPYTRRLMRATPRPGVSLRALLPEEDGHSSKAHVMAGLDPAIHHALQEMSTEAMDPRVNPRRRGIGGSPGGDALPPPLLAVENLVKEYPRQGVTPVLDKLLRRKSEGNAPFRAVDDVSFAIQRGESLGLVGESGCGKSTTSMIITRLIDATGGRVMFNGEDIAAIPAKAFARTPQRAQIQMVFQDPTDSLNPRFTAARSIADPVHRLGALPDRGAVRAKVEDCARLVGLPLNLLDRFPHQLSGGQKARVGIARAIALRPQLLILDEPTAALDVSVQAVVLNLLLDLKAELGMSYLFVSHDLQVVRLLCDRVIVMRGGKIVEQGPTDQVLGQPATDYTRELLAAIPHPPV